MINRPGAIPFQLMREMMAAGYIQGAEESALQPSSLDMTLTDEVYRLRGSYLPRPGEPVNEIAKQGALYSTNLNLPLEVNGIYLIKLKETLNLPKSIHATASNKSSSGRIDLRSRLVMDGVPRFDSIPSGYKGSLWLEVVPKSFPIRLHPGDRINQIRFFHGDSRFSSLEHRILYDRFGLLRDSDGNKIQPTDEVVRDGITMTIDLTSRDLIGWSATRSATNVLDTAKFDHNPNDFFEPIYQPANGELTLRPGTFYILVTKEKVLVPPTLAMEMANYDPSKGEFRSHFAGFFDPGWGWREKDEERGTAAVLEVEAYGHEFVLRDGQPICLMVYERLLATPEKIYGTDLGSHYSEQSGPRLAKWFISHNT
ncbi:MAG: 2'-deoxycytidine 5'-triphosphate deaminase [Patescibacteria group bacterium]|nr:2'-deoxycytidine 5'-triphosphate deaminase [Patescibacteria group bacterium]MBU2509460.1 2'-deoxycytidine 5'-triphosphate deaminase [Patescibacteria group bacterium]